MGLVSLSALCGCSFPRQDGLKMSGLKVTEVFALSVVIGPADFDEGTFPVGITNDYEEPLIAEEIFEFPAPEG